MKRILVEWIAQQKKVLTWVKRVVGLVIWYVLSTYYKEETKAFLQNAVEFLKTNWLTMVRCTAIFGFAIALILAAWFLVMLCKVGIDGVDEMFENGEHFMVRIIKKIVHWIAHL